MGWVGGLSYQYSFGLGWWHLLPVWHWIRLVILASCTAGLGLIVLATSISLGWVGTPLLATCTVKGWVHSVSYLYIIGLVFCVSYLYSVGGFS